MKAIVTLIFGLMISTAAMANTPAKQMKVETKTMKVELNITIKKATVQKSEVARLYMYKNSRIKKELAFRTKAKRARIA